MTYVKILFLVFLLLFGSCDSQKESTNGNNSNKPIVAVSNYPLYYFAKIIAGDFMDINFPIIEGDPAYWMPSPEQLGIFQNAQLIVLNGSGYEQWLERVSLPSSKIVDTSIGFKDQWIEAHDDVQHSHGKEGAHVHKGTAFTTWLNFKIAVRQAESISKAFSELMPDHKEQFNQNYMTLRSELFALDQRMNMWVSKSPYRQIITSHPVYQYLQSGYGLSLSSLHWEPNEMPSEDQWKKLELMITDHESVIMIWESKPIEAIESMLDRLKIKFIVFDPCANKPKYGDFVYIMKENLDQLENVITKN